MNPIWIATIIASTLLAAVWIGRMPRRLLPEHHLNADTKDTVKLAMGRLVVIFLSFSLLAPPNGTTTIALTVSALSVAGAILLILELDRPFGGLIKIPNESC